MKTSNVLLTASIMLVTTCFRSSNAADELRFGYTDRDYSFKQEYKVTSPINLKISTSGGNVTAIGQEDNTVEVSFIVMKRGQVLDITLDDLKKLAEVEIKSDDANLEINIKKNFEKNLSVSFYIKTPYKTSANLMTSGGNVSITGIIGMQKLGTSGGNVDCDNINGSVEANTSGGNISIINSKADYNASTSGGNISMSNIDGKLSVSTSGGNIDASNISHGLTAHTSGGNINVGDIQGFVNLNTSGGSIHMDKISGSVKAITSGGDISANIVQLSDKLELETSGGNINTSIPAGLGLNLDLSADHINMELTNFSGTSKKDRVNGQMNGGGIGVHLSTSGGEITMKFQ